MPASSIAPTTGRPSSSCCGSRLPDAAAVAAHDAAHARCYIANSIRSKVRIEGSWRAA